MENVRELFQVLNRRFGFLNKNCCCVDGCEISLVQSHILYEIDRQHQPSIQRIADTLGTDITTFSRQVKSLIEMNLVQKTADPADRRVYLLSLTSEGQKVAKMIDQQMQDYLEEVFSHLDELEKETVLRSIQLLNEAMSKSSRCCTAPIG